MVEKVIKKISYLGGDLAYWGNIQKFYGNVYKDDIESFVFSRITTKDDPSLHRSFKLLVNNPPDILYLDFTGAIEAVYNLGKNLRFCNSTKNITLIGLVDGLNHEVALKCCQWAGIIVSHIKGVELHDVVYDGMTLSFPNEAIEPDFARASFEEWVSLRAGYRLNYLNKEKIKVEGNFPLPEGEIVDIDWPLDPEVLPTHKVVVEKSSELDSWYLSQDLSLTLSLVYAEAMTEKKQKEMIFNLGDPYSDHVKVGALDHASDSDEDEVSPLLQFADDEEEDDVQDEKSLRRLLELDGVEEEGPFKEPSQELLDLLKQRFFRWIRNNPTEGVEKEVKILIIDKKLSVLEQMDRMVDQYPYLIKLQDNLQNIDKEINRFRPNIIAFEFEPFPPSLTEKDDRYQYNNIETLKEIVSIASGQYGYDPFIIVFNNPTYTSESCRDSFEYAQIMANPTNVNLNVILKLAKVLQSNIDKKKLSLAKKKLKSLLEENPERYKDIPASDLMEKRLYFEKDDHLSTVVFKQQVRLTSLTESELTFISDIPIPMYKQFELRLPIHMAITVVPKKVNSTGSSMDNSYRALIHSIDEKDKQRLRQFVNSVFGKGQEEKRNIEIQEIEELKQRYLETKGASDKKD